MSDPLGVAICSRHLGDIVIRKNDEATRSRNGLKAPAPQHEGSLQEAWCHYRRAIYARSGDIQEEALSYQRLGDIARDRSQMKDAIDHYRQALGRWERIERKKNTALAHEDLAAVTEGAERAAHVAAAVAAWREMGLEDRVARVERRFG